MKSLLCFKVIHFNPNRSLVSKHILFYYWGDSLAL